MLTDKETLRAQVCFLWLHNIKSRHRQCASSPLPLGHYIQLHGLHTAQRVPECSHGSQAKSTLWLGTESVGRLGLFLIFTMKLLLVKPHACGWCLSRRGAILQCALKCLIEQPVQSAHLLAHQIHPRPHNTIMCLTTGTPWLPRWGELTSVHLCDPSAHGFSKPLEWKAG